MDYSQLSDFEINKRVAKSIYSVSFVDPLCRTVSVSGAGRLFDPCNNPADAWPIIDKYRISIINLGEDEWGARGVADCKSKRAIHENSLRAAMIVFLMMQDAKHA